MESEETNARLVADAAAHLVDSAQKLDRASRLLPSDEEFHFCSNFSEFREPMTKMAARVRESLSKFSSLGFVSRFLPVPPDHDDLPDWLVSMQDELLEQVDSAFDLFKKERAQQGLSPPENDAFMYQKSRKKRRRDIPPRKEINAPLEAGGKAVSIQIEKCPVPFHLWSIPRPQDKFDIPVDNSNKPFRHPRPPSSVLQNAEPDVPTHPLLEELQNMSFEGSLVGVAELKQPAFLEETPFTFVNTPSLLEDTAAKLALESEIAVDLEHHHFRSFQGLTCLMQISTCSEDFIIDTLELRSIIGQHLYDIFASPTIQKVMHGARWDVMWLQRDFGIYMCNLFDTGQAARVLELESFGLAHLLTQFCGFTPDKRYQMADWRLRPLPAEMIKYAREDTHYLLYIKDVLKQKLLSLKSTSEDCLLEVLRRSRDICLKLYEKEQTMETSYLQVYGLEAMNFNSQQLAVLSGLYSWRDQVARAEDESTGYVLPNHLLLKLAEEMPEDVKMLRTLLNGRHTVVARNSATIVDIIKKMKMSSQRPTTEGHSSLDIAINKSAPLFDEIPFPGASTVAAVLKEERKSGLGSPKGSCIITGNSEVQASAVVNRAATSSLFNEQKVRDKASNYVEVPPKNADYTHASTGGETPLKSNFSGGASASRVMVKRASGSSLFGKAKQMNQAVHYIQDTSQTVGNEPLEASRTIGQDTNTPGREVEDLTSKLGNRTSLQLEFSSNTWTEDFEQAEAASRAKIIRASFSLPFYTFEGWDSSVQVHQKGTAEQVPSEDHAAKSALQNTEPELGLQESNDVILLDADIHDDTSEGWPEEAEYVVSKDIGILPDGVQYRLWWPDTTKSSPETSLGKTEVEQGVTANSNIMEMKLPSPLSQRFKSQRSLQNNSPSSKLSNSDANNSGQEEPDSFDHKNQMQTRITPFDYEAAKSNMALFRVLHGTDEHADRSNFSSLDHRRRENTQVFEPGNNIKEFKSEGITPGKRRQVFPQSGNRTGVFK